MNNTYHKSLSEALPDINRIKEKRFVLDIVVSTICSHAVTTDPMH
jgi:hypothetical protein